MAIKIGTLYKVKGKILVSEAPDDSPWINLKCNMLVLLEKSKYSKSSRDEVLKLRRYKFISPSSGKVYYAFKPLTATYYFEKTFFHEVC